MKDVSELSVRFRSIGLQTPYMKGEHVYILHAFVKKTQKTPKQDLDLAKTRMKEVSK
jgi:phage-related protein